MRGENCGWVFLPDLGRGEGCMGIDNVVAASDTTGRGAYMEYDVTLSPEGRIAIGILPVQDIRPERGLRLCVQLDNMPVRIIDARQGLHDEFGEYTPEI